MHIETLYRAYKTPLFSLAYRMLGSVMDAEDIVQEAFLRYEQLPHPEQIRNERAFLYKVVTNRCLDVLRSSAKKREMYVGPWLPEPLLDYRDAEADLADTYLQKESISTAYLLLLQQLNAVERAVFLLHEIFRYSHDEIADMIGKSSANCRQIFHRAKKSIHFDPEQSPTVQVAEEKVKEFVNSLLQGNVDQLMKLVSENVVFYSDGGGKVRAAQVPVAGAEQVVRLQLNLVKMYEGRFACSFVSVNGAPGLRIRMDDGVQYIYSFAYRNHQIEAIYAVANPEKLRHL